MRFEIPPIDKVDIRLLKVFKAVTECNGLAAAEETLNLSRSTISIHISDLETRFGVKLCTRGPAGFALTPQGQVVYEATLGLFGALNSFRATVAGAKGQLMGELTIWLMDNLATDPLNPLVPALQRFHERPNAVALTVNVAPSNDVERAVYDGRCDVGLSGSNGRLQGLSYEQMHTEEIMLYCGAGHPLFEKALDAIASEDLREIDFIRRGYVTQHEERVETNWESSVVAMHTEGTLQLILSGLYVGYLPSHYAAKWEASGQVRRINPQRFKVDWPVYLITREPESRSILVSALREDLLAFGRGQDCPD